MVPNSMKVSRNLLALATATATATVSSAFVVPSTSSSTVCSAPMRTFFTNTHPFPKSLTKKSLPVGTALQMNFLTDLFGGGGGGSGSYGAKIQYSTLDHPGPELGTAAESNTVLVSSPRDPQLLLATFAGGCFWGLELAYQRVPGVVYTAVGYAQGKEVAPTYGQVCSGSTGHTEAVLVYYDPSVASYEALLDVFFDRVDPTTVNGQGNDYGTQYRTGVYYHSSDQEQIARDRFELEKGNYRRPIASECKAAMPFWPAEKYHQQYLEKGGRFGTPQNAAKGATDTIRCYG